MPISVTIETVPPSADLFLSSLPSGTTSIKVWRVSVMSTRVRGDDQVPVVAGAARLQDFDIPIGRPFAYRAESYGADGAILGSISVTADNTVNGITANQMWLSDPLIPQLAQLVTLDRRSDESRTYEAPVTYATVIGRRRPNAISGQRGAASDWTFVLKSYSHADALSLDDMFAGGGVLLARPHPDALRHRTGIIYLSAPSIVETPRRDFAYQSQRSDWTLSAREVFAPGASVIAPSRTWDTVKGEFADWQDIRDNGGTWLDVLRG